MEVDHSIQSTPKTKSSLSCKFLQRIKVHILNYHKQRTEEENKKVLDFFAYDYTYFWTGLNDIDEEGVLKTSDGVVLGSAEIDFVYIYASDE